MNKEKVKEVFSNEEYVKNLLAMHSYEEVQKSLAENDIDFSVEELRKMHKLLIKKAKNELSDNELAEIAGGYWEFIAVSVLMFGTCGTGLGIILGTDVC